MILWGKNLKAHIGEVPIIQLMKMNISTFGTMIENWGWY